MKMRFKTLKRLWKSENLIEELDNSFNIRIKGLDYQFFEESQKVEITRVKRPFQILKGLGVLRDLLNRNFVRSFSCTEINLKGNLKQTIDLSAFHQELLRRKLDAFYQKSVHPAIFYREHSTGDRIKTKTSVGKKYKNVPKYRYTTIFGNGEITMESFTNYFQVYTHLSVIENILHRIGRKD